MEPISPDEIGSYAGKVFPDFVIAAVNNMITKYYTGRSATFYQALLEKEIKTLSGSDSIESWWLNFEELYRSKGWEVYYDQPGFNECYSPSYQFRKK